MFLALKTTFSAKKDKKYHENHFKRISSLLDIEGPILDTVRYCENRDSVYEILSPD